MKELTDNRPDLLRDAREIFDLRTSAQPISTLLSQIDLCEIERGVLLPINCEKSRGSKMPSNDEVTELVKHTGERLIGFASVDPNTGREALSEVRRSHDQLGLMGLKLNPAFQEFDPTGRRATLKNEMDYEQMKALGSDSNIADFVKETLQDVLEDRSALSLYGRKMNSTSVVKLVSGL